jgi:hypothetical protein
MMYRTYKYSNNIVAVGLGDKLMLKIFLFCNNPFLMSIKSKVYLLFA